LPNEWDELNRRLAQPRPSLSPSTFPEDEYQRFVEEDASAFNEDAVKNTVLPSMLKAMGASNGAQKNILFSNIDPLVPGISQAKPDYYYGAKPELIDQQVREDLGQHSVPSTSTQLPTVPNFSIEAKGPLGTNREALLQACHIGAVGARAMHSLQNYHQNEPVYDGKVSSISSIYSGGQLKMYAHSVAQPNSPGTLPQYYMHQLGNVGMTHSKDTFLQGATLYKNAHDLTEEYRNAAIEHANAMAAAWAEEEEEEEDIEADSSQTLRSFAHSTLGGEEDSEESAMSEDEDSNRRPPANRPSRRSSRSGRRKRNQFQ
jgi:hypothetical protein